MYVKGRFLCWIRAGGGCLCEGRENSLKYLKRVLNRKEGWGNKDFKRGRQAGSGGVHFRKGRAGTPLQTMMTF